MTKQGNKGILPLPIDKVFLIVGLVYGILYVYINPPFHANDEDRHFYRAYAIANGKFTPIQQAEDAGNKVGQVYPANVIEVAKKFQGMPFANGYKISMEDYFEPLKDAEITEDTTFHIYPYYHISAIPYIPQSLGIFTGEIFTSKVIRIQWFGRLFGMLCFILIAYFAVRITPIMKPVFFLSALTPMTLYQASSITYDMLSIATTFLLIALFFRFAFDKDSVLTTRDIVVILIVAVIHRFSKDGYILIPFLFFLIPPAKLKPVWRPALMAGVFIILYFLPDMTWGSYVSGLNFRPGGQTPFQNDFHFDRSLNMQHNLENPGQFIANIWTNVMYWKDDWYRGLIGKFGYSYSTLPNGFYVIHGLFFLFVAFISGEKNIKMKAWQKTLVLAVTILTIMLIVVGFYLGGSPIGAVRIFGMQGRYFVPLLPLIFVPLYNTAFASEKWKKYEGLILGLYVIIMLSWTVFFMKDYFYQA